jgi:hypothetical protein
MAGLQELGKRALRLARHDYRASRATAIRIVFISDAPDQTRDRDWSNDHISLPRLWFLSFLAT